MNRQIQPTGRREQETTQFQKKSATAQRAQTLLERKTPPSRHKGSSIGVNTTFLRRQKKRRRGEEGKNFALSGDGASPVDAFSAAVGREWQITSTARVQKKWSGGRNREHGQEKKSEKMYSCGGAGDCLLNRIREGQTMFKNARKRDQKRGTRVVPPKRRHETKREA